MRMRKFICILLFAVFVVLAGCNQEEKGDGNLVWRIVTPLGLEGDMVTITSRWEDSINALLKEKNVEYSVQIEALDSENSTADELESLRKSGEQTDIISLLSATAGGDLEGYYLVYPECVKRGLLLSLDALLDTEEGEVLHSAIPAKDLERAKVDGGTYGLSAVLPAMKAVMYSKEQMDEYGITADELTGSIFEHEDILQKIKDITGKTPYGITFVDACRELGLWVLEPCENVVLNTEGKFVNVTETQEFREYLAKLLDWKEKGLVQIVEDPFNITNFARDFSQEAMYSDKSCQVAISMDMGGGVQEKKEFLAVPDETKPVLSPYWGDNKIGIASWTKEKENAEDFLIRLLTDAEIANVIQYGEEKLDYTLYENVVNVPSGTNPVLRFFGYQYTNPMITYSTAWMAQEKQEFAESFYETYEKGIPDGFRFDPTPVLTQIVAANRVFGDGFEENNTPEVAEKIKLLEIEDLDKTIEEITLELKAAGIDEVVAEANRQLEEWKKGAGK